MPKIVNKISFYYNLYKSLLNSQPYVSIPSKSPISAIESFPKVLKIFFWTPSMTAGANIIVHNVIPEICNLLKQVDLDWDIQTGSSLPDNTVDFLVCFKAVPPKNYPKKWQNMILLICDQADVFWKDIPSFDRVVATSSLPFAYLLNKRHQDISFISESETILDLEWGKANLSRNVESSKKVIMWHGGLYSQSALEPLQAAFTRISEKHPIEIHVISGNQETRVISSNSLDIRYFPWSKEQLYNSASIATLGIIPARDSIKNCWLKPASRVRCLYGLGVPTIGDSRVPDVVDFSKSFGGPLAGDPKSWEFQISHCLNNLKNLQLLAWDGYSRVLNDFSTVHTARQWIRFFKRTNQIAGRHLIVSSIH